jgi:hypothetical protein
MGRRNWSGIAVTFLAIVAIASVGYSLYYSLHLTSGSSSSGSSSSVLTWVGTALGGVGIIGAVVGVVETWRSRYRRRRLEARIASAEDVAAFEEEDREFFALGTEDRRLLRYRAERDEAEKELGPYLPANPRQAKRIINHERLYALIAEDRGIFGGNPELTHRHLAKWVLILEHWPRLGAALTREPAKMQEIEECLTVEMLGQVIDSLISGTQVTDELFQFLRGGVPLSSILDRLVRFEPSAVDDL